MTTVSGMVISYSQGVDRLRQRTDNTPPMLIVPAVKRGARISGSRRALRHDQVSKIKQSLSQGRASALCCP
jgi:hypothetical protein